MVKMQATLLGLAALVCAGCGGGQGAAETEAADSWDGWQSWTKVSTDEWISKTHGKRFVEVYVNDTGLAAYQDEGAEIPVGTVIVKPSWENQGGQPGVEGPVFVMEKKAAGFAPDSGDWYYAFLWENPTGTWKDKGPIRWQSPSDDVTYCVDCHDIYDRQLGYVPEDKRAW